MHFRIGLLGIGLVAAFVVGGVANGPPYPPNDVPPMGIESANDAPSFGSPGQAFETAGQALGSPGPALGSPGQAIAAPGPPFAPTGGNDFANLPTTTANSGPQAAAAGDLIGFNGFTGSGSQTITLVHTGKMQIAVYHIDRSGAIRLVSSRPIDADFSLSLNVTAPLPGQIRILGGQAK